MEVLTNEEKALREQRGSTSKEAKAEKLTRQISDIGNYHKQIVAYFQFLTRYPLPINEMRTHLAKMKESLPQGSLMQDFENTIKTLSLLQSEIKDNGDNVDVRKWAYDCSMKAGRNRHRTPLSHDWPFNSSHHNAVWI